MKVPRIQLFRIVRFAALALALFAESAHSQVAIDIGHTVANSGSRSVAGESEFSFNRRLGLAIADSLAQQNLRTTVINQDGDIKSLLDRTRAARGASLFLSVHHDSVQAQFMPVTSSHFSGFSIWVSRANTNYAGSSYCARKIADSLIQAGYRPSTYHADAVEGESRVAVDLQRGIFLNDNLAVLRTATSAAILLEAGVIVNPMEEEQLKNPAIVTKQAKVVAMGVKSCFQ